MASVLRRCPGHAVFYQRLDQQILLHDANFNVTALVDNSAAVQERYAYTPYGQATFLDASYTPLAPQSSPLKQKNLYTGRELDAETLLYYYRARYYHCTLGRFVGRDLIGYEGGDSNLYRYVKDNPVHAVDPSGLEKKITHVSICDGLGDEPDFTQYVDSLQKKFKCGSHKDAFDLTQQLEEITKDGDCIKVLEVYGHGNPDICAMIKHTPPGETGRNRAPNICVRWLGRLANRGGFCNDCEIYLSGCNTGLGGNAGIAQEMAEITGCKVYGSKGYMAGTHFNRDEKCTPDYPRDPKSFPVYPGSVNGTGKQCWKEFTPTPNM